tara:strand:+ start:432 stop:641 length:210 start_codon:yes stop_codon:yes gene_type:complete
MNTMCNPSVGTMWVNNVDKNEIITIVKNSETTCSRKNIVYKYERTGHIGGCNSKEWFYSDWTPLNNKKN